MKHEHIIKSLLVTIIGFVLLFQLGCHKEENEELPLKNYILIVNTISETISIYDLEKDTVFEDILETGKTPNDILIQGDIGFIVNSGFGGIAALDVINLREKKLIKRIPLPVGSNPYCIASSGDKFYITLAASNKILILDKNLQPVDTLSVGKWPEGIVYHNGKIYVAVSGFNITDFTYGDGYLYIINTSSTPYFVDSIKVGKNPQLIKVFNDKIYIMCTGDYASSGGGFYVFNPSTGMIEDSIIINFNPQDFVFYKDKYFFTDFAHGIFSTPDGRTIDTLIIINGSNRMILAENKILASIFSATELNYLVIVDPDSLCISWIAVGQAKGAGPIGLYRKY